MESKRSRKRIEFIEEYLCPGDENNGYHDSDYQYFDNHGVLIRCKDCKWRNLDNCPMEFYWDSHQADDEAFCSFGVKKLSCDPDYCEIGGGGDES